MDATVPAQFDVGGGQVDRNLVMAQGNASLGQVRGRHARHETDDILLKSHESAHGIGGHDRHDATGTPDPLQGVVERTAGEAAARGRDVGQAAQVVEGQSRGPAQLRVGGDGGDEVIGPT